MHLKNPLYPSITFHNFKTEVLSDITILDHFQKNVKNNYHCLSQLKNKTRFILFIKSYKKNFWV